MHFKTPARSRGQALVEFALVFPILMVMLIAIFDLGRAVFAYNDITNAAREGARLAIVDQTVASIKNEAASQATSLGLTAADVQVEFDTEDRTGPCPADKTLDCVAVVTVTYKWHAITPVIGNIVGPMDFTAESAMPLERIFP